MKKDVLISIKGLQFFEDSSDSIEIMTCGRYYRRNNRYYLSYDETESTGYEGCRTTLCVEDSRRVTVRRTGPSSSNLIVERGRRHQCSYDTELGAIVVGICGDNIRSTLDDRGGELDFSYSMDINTALASENRVIVHVKECES